MKKLRLVLLILGVGFLVYLVWTIGLAELWRELTSLGWGLLPLILSEGVAEMLHTVGWHYCLSGAHRYLPLTLLFRIRMAGYAINYVTPSASLGGEVTKAALLASNHHGPEAVSGVLIDKVCTAFTHLLLVLVGCLVLVWHIHLPTVLWVGMGVSGALVASGIAAFLLIQKYGKLGVVLRWLAARNRGSHGLQTATRKITEVDEVLKVFYRERPLDLCLAMCWHFLGHLMGIVQTWLFFILLHREASWTTVTGAWFLTMWFDLLTFAVPLNLGSLEGTRILALKAIGYDALLGMTFGVMLRLAQLFWAAFGLVNHGLLTSQEGGAKALESGLP